MLPPLHHPASCSSIADLAALAHCSSNHSLGLPPLDLRPTTPDPFGFLAATPTPDNVANLQASVSV